MPSESTLTAPVELPGGHHLDPGASPFRWSTLPAASPPRGDLTAILPERLRRPTAGPPLTASVPVLVIVPDATRATFVRPMVEATTGHLCEEGLAPDDVHLLIAGGLHRPPTPPELVRLLGDEIARRHPIHVHDADDPSLTHCGTTRRGTPVFLPRRLLAARTLVLIGGITPHYFAGWTGGLKGLVPGAAGSPTITANHRLAVDPRRPSGLHLACREGGLRANPVALDLVEAASRAPAPFLVNVVLGRAGEPRALVAGRAKETHRAGVKIARRAVGVGLAPYPLVVVAAGDPGRERDWIQAHKVVRQGAACTADGGTLIALVACPDGPGSATLLDWFAIDTVHGHTALAIGALTRRIRVILVTQLKPAIVQAMGMERAASLDEALAAAAGRLPRGSPALLLPRAGTLLPRRVLR
jgi:nickel-dependent lactate racemase